MNKLPYLLVILFCTSNLAIGQKSRAKGNRGLQVSQYTKATRAWPAFWSEFKAVVEDRNYDRLADLMVLKHLDCWIDDPSMELDLRKQCINDWKVGKPNHSEVNWSDFKSLVLSRHVCAITKDIGLGWTFTRFVQKDSSCSSDGGVGARFVFLNGVWLLQAFKAWESE